MKITIYGWRIRASDRKFVRGPERTSGLSSCNVWVALRARRPQARSTASGERGRQLRWRHRNKVPARNRATLAVSLHGS